MASCRKTSHFCALLVLLALICSLILPVQSQFCSPEKSKHDFCKRENSKSTDLLNRQEDYQRKKNVHAILSGVSWGILIPISVIMGKLQVHNHSWNGAQGIFLVSGYAIGIAAWLTGMNLGNEPNSAASHSATHRNIGIAIFSLATAQIFFGFIFSLWVRMSENPWVNFWWNFFHGEVGAAVAVLSIVNVFNGLNILRPASENWIIAYIALVSVWGSLYVLVTCYWMLSGNTHPSDEF